MSLLTTNDTLGLWQTVVKEAEGQCAIILEKELEAYLVALLMRYTNQPDVLQHTAATSFLNAFHNDVHRTSSLQHVGDQCLLFSGLFPRIAEKRHVKLSYFVKLGQSAYSAISGTANDLYGSLSMQFVMLMDVLQSIRQPADLLPLEAYEQWSTLGSQRALQMLQSYQRTHVIPFKK